MKKVALACLVLFVSASTCLGSENFSDWSPSPADPKISRIVSVERMSNGRCLFTYRLRNDYSHTVHIRYAYDFRPGSKKFDHTAYSVEPGEYSQAATGGPCGPFYITAQGVEP